MKNYFPAEVYNTPLGSFALCEAISNEKLKTEKDRQHFKTLYFRAKKKKWKMDDPQLLEKIAKFFECEFKIENIAMIVSPYNILFSFYVYDEEGKCVVLPLQEDGTMSITLKTGKIYPLSEVENVLE